MRYLLFFLVGLLVGASIGWVSTTCCLSTPLELAEADVDGNFADMAENRNERATYASLVQDLLEQGYQPNDHPVWVYLDEISRLDEVYEQLREYQEEFNIRLDELRDAEPYCCS